MKFAKEHFFCNPPLLQNVDEVREIERCIEAVQWAPEFRLEVNGKVSEHQTAYNKALDAEFAKYAWEPQPVLDDDPLLIGDFRKGDVFVEVQFGNSATLYRDYYKFHFGLTHNLLALAVLLMPTKPGGVFPHATRERAEHGRVFPRVKVVSPITHPRPHPLNRSITRELNKS